MQKWSNEPVWRDLEPARESIQKQFKANPNHGLAAEYRRVRAQSRFDLIGDWPILSLIVEVAHNLGIKFSRFSTRLALSQIEDWKTWRKAQKMAFTTLLETQDNDAPVSTKLANEAHSTARKGLKVQVDSHTFAI